MPKKSQKLQMKLKQQKQRVNTMRICICVRLRRATTLFIGCSLIILISYGFPYWFDFAIDRSIRYKQPWSYYTYVSIITLECLTSLCACSAVYYHIRCMVKYSLYYVFIHLIYIPLLFYFTNLLHVPYYPLFITWVAFQFIVMYLLWKYKQILKEVYDWDDNDEEDEDTETCDDDTPYEPAPIAAPNKNRTVSVSVNVSQPSTVIYHAQQPSLPQMPIVHMQNIHQPVQYQQRYDRIRTISNDTVHGRSRSNNGSEASNISAHKAVKSAKTINRATRHYRRVATEDLELDGMDPIDIKSNESDSDSEGMYINNNTTNDSPVNETAVVQTVGSNNEVTQHLQENMLQDLLIANSKPLPEGDSEEEEMEIMTKEGDMFDIWLIDTLKECAPLNHEWNSLWNNFKKNNVTQETLHNLCDDKQRYHEEWSDLIPKIGTRIQFQQALEKKMLPQHPPQAPPTQQRGEDHVYPSPF